MEKIYNFVQKLSTRCHLLIIILSIIKPLNEKLFCISGFQIKISYFLSNKPKICLKSSSPKKEMKPKLILYRYIYKIRILHAVRKCSSVEVYPVLTKLENRTKIYKISKSLFFFVDSYLF